MDCALGATVIVSLVVAVALFVSNVRMTNRALKDLEEQRKQPWNWN